MQKIIRNIILTFGLVFTASAQDSSLQSGVIYLMPVNAPDSINHRNKMDEKGRKIGKWEYYSRTGKLILAVNYENNRRNGEYIRYQPTTGKPFEIGSYKNGVRDGLYVRYFTDGTVRVKGQYKNGLKNGVWEYYYRSSGSIRAKGKFENGRKNGTWNFFDYSEVLKRTMEYSNGKIIQSDDTIQFMNKTK